ncbi:hypothetical protein [Moorella sp. Hama-1]|uniref:hypothetical protein n=1 Tax=Moorella sp. Hama-1 TaxID=2138101 RepID=UPI000D65A554|nr:hypothetical protein [Moorella sp. Hama-1]BCV21313.1 hypothetical protein hamaS1_13820 [Moorella sp. Hama-1]
MSTEVRVIIDRIRAVLKDQKLHFAEILDLFPDSTYRAFLQAWSELQTAGELGREPDGRYFLAAKG